VKCPDYREIFRRIFRLLPCKMRYKDTMKVTADISLSLLTTIMSPRRSNLEHFTRDTRSLPVGSCTRHAWQGCIYSQGCARLLDKHDRATHDWGSLIEHLEMNNGWWVIIYFLFCITLLKNTMQQMQIWYINFKRIHSLINFTYFMYCILSLSSVST